MMATQPRYTLEPTADGEFRIIDQNDGQPIKDDEGDIVEQAKDAARVTAAMMNGLYGGPDRW